MYGRILPSWSCGFDYRLLSLRSEAKILDQVIPVSCVRVAQLGLLTSSQLFVTGVSCCGSSRPPCDYYARFRPPPGQRLGGPSALPGARRPAKTPCPPVPLAGPSAQARRGTGL